MSGLSWIEPLPIDTHLRRIADLVGENRVVIVEAEPGAGKTTHIPPSLVAWLNTTVEMTLPRRAAVPMIGERIAAELGDQPGRLVGWVLTHEEPLTSDETRLTLRVTQSMVNWITRHKRLPDGVLLIDEAHERSVPIDLLLGLAKQYLPECPRSRVLVTSATIDTEKFGTFFWDAPIVRVEGRCFPVEVRPYQLDKLEHHTDGAAAAAIQELTEFAKEGSVRVAEGRATEGTIIVLLPGMEDIRSVEELIGKEAVKYPDTAVEILTLSGQSSQDDRNKVNSPVPAKTLRFVLGTEVLRASVTVPGCIGVIDSMQLRRRECDVNGIGHLKKVSVSRAEADQGKGRAGRVSNGFYRPVVLKDEFANLERYPKPAILREPISSIVLQIAASGLDARTFQFIDAPSPRTIETAVSRLQRLGLLDDDGVITSIGKELVGLQVDPELGKALITARELEVLPETIIAVAGLMQGSIFDLPKPNNKLVVEEHTVRQILAHLVWDEFASRLVPAGNLSDSTTVDLDPDKLPSWIVKKEIKPKQQRKPSKGSSPEIELWEVDCSAVDFPFPKERAAWVASLARKAWTGKSRNDFVALMRAWRDFMAASKRLRERYLREWCVSHGLNYRRTQLLTQVVKQLRIELDVPEKELLEHRQFPATHLTKALLTGLIDNVGCNLDSEKGKGRNPQYNSMLGHYTLVYQSAAHSACPLVLAGSVRKAFRSGNLVADMAAPVHPEWLGEMLPQLCSVTTRGLREEAHFNGLLVGIEEPPAPVPLAALSAPLVASEPACTEEPAKEETTPPVAPPAPTPPVPVPMAMTPQPEDQSLWPVAEPESSPEDAPPPPPDPDSGDSPSLQEQIRHQTTLAQQVTLLYEQLSQSMAKGIDRDRVRGAMRPYCTAPDSPDAKWVHNAQLMIAYVQDNLVSAPPAA